MHFAAHGLVSSGLHCSPRSKHTRAKKSATRKPSAFIIAQHFRNLSPSPNYGQRNKRPFTDSDGYAVSVVLTPDMEPIISVFSPNNCKSSGKKFSHFEDQKMNVSAPIVLTTPPPNGSSLLPNYTCGLLPVLPPFLGIPEVLSYLQAGMATLSAIIGLPLNIYLMVIILKYTKLRKRRYLTLALQVIMVEIAYHLWIPATIVTSTVTDRWIFGGIACSITGMLHDGFAMYRFAMTFVLTVDRFVSVFWPTQYEKKGMHVVILLLSLAWTLTVLRILLPSRWVLDCFLYIPTFRTCTLFPKCSLGYKHLGAWSISIIVMLGVFLPLIFYCVIFCKARKVKKVFIKSESSLQVGSTTGCRRSSKLEEIAKAYYRLKRNQKKFVSGLFLINSIIVTTPAFTLYITSLFKTTPNKAVFVTNMMVGRTFFNFIPVFDALALLFQEDIREVTKRLIYKDAAPDSRVCPEMISVRQK